MIRCNPCSEQLGLSFSQPCQVDVERIPPDTHGEAPALVGAREETRGVSVHLLVLEPGRGAVRSFATQGCPEIVCKTQRETDASPVHGTHVRVMVWVGLEAFLWLRKSQGPTDLRVLLNNENTLEKPLCAHVHISLFWETKYP